MSYAKIWKSNKRLNRSMIVQELSTSSLTAKKSVEMTDFVSEQHFSSREHTALFIPIEDKNPRK